jgi:hypothetical protein
MKLNLTIQRAEPKTEIWGYASLAKLNPIGWWKVTTEGDCEGRSTDTLGTFYGHVAEIAFANRKKSSYSLRFEPVKGMVALADRPAVAVVAGAKEKEIKVHISFAYSMLDGCKPNPKAVAAWLDADDVIVTESNYYDAILLTMKVA